MALLDSDEFDRWRRQASSARAAAEVTNAAGSWAWCCFLCEQSAQLAVKGLLHAIGRPDEGWGHDLVVFVARASKTVGDTMAASDVGDAAARLARHYIPARYPDAHPSGSPADHYREADATAALSDAASVLAAVDGAWSTLVAGQDEAP